MCFGLHRLIEMATTLMVGSSSTFAEIRLPKLLSEHDVLQRGQPIHVWGWATPESKVQIRFHSQSLSSRSNGEWRAWLMPEAAGGPYSLTVEGDGEQQTVTVSDLLIGDVWLASDQSNMEMPLLGFPPNAVVKNAEAEIRSCVESSYAVTGGGEAEQ
jgi:sialate O-acetylesterase